ncbi:hypothetical protein [Shimia thalassica]|uniref:hypothetical protein n=1 Tax=Shimia thalassica TaxID=1715693 RepID=UPI0026E2B9C9|nr:hypothetical protein [Shimia thalassica]MDO6800437.1 hypothetical protein [Shimia thalassica]
MAQAEGWEFGSKSEQLYIHFDVDDHFLKLETFIRTAGSAQRIIEALDETFFQGKLEYELIVLPPEPGSFLSKLAVWIGGGITGLYAFANTDIGSAYIEALTGQSPIYWAEQAGEHNRKMLQDLGEWVDELTEDELEELEAEIGDAKPTPVAFPSPDSEEACRVGARIVVEMTRGMLSKETTDLERLGMDTGSLPDAVDARSDFYFACLEDADVKRIGFSDDADFPIPRNSFPQRAVKPPRPEKKDDPIPWVVSVENIYVTSPNWDKEDQKSRQWKGKDAIRRDCYFVIEDAEFWFHVRQKDLSVDVLDNLKVQWAYQEIGGRIRNRRVLRVLEFNGDKLADPLTASAIRAILGEYSSVEARRGQPSLFDDGDA